MNRTPEHSVHALARDICEHLPKWEYLQERSRKNDDGRSFPVAYIGSGDLQMMLDMRGYGSKAGHIEVRGIVPTHDDQHRWVGTKAPTMGCNGARGGKAIAKDIARRMLPDLQEAHERAQALVDEQNDYASGIAKTRAKLVAGGRGRSTHSEGAFSLYCSDMEGWVDGTVNSADSVSLRLHSLDAALALKICKLVAKQTAK